MKGQTCFISRTLGAQTTWKEDTEKIENTGVHKLVTKIKNNTPLNTRHTLRYRKMQIKKKYKDYDSATASLGRAWEGVGTGAGWNAADAPAALDLGRGRRGGDRWKRGLDVLG